jgi:hypothetical protein
MEKSNICEHLGENKNSKHFDDVPGECVEFVRKCHKLWKGKLGKESRSCRNSHLDGCRGLETKLVQTRPIPVTGDSDQVSRGDGRGPRAKYDLRRANFKTWCLPLAVQLGTDVA